MRSRQQNDADDTMREEADEESMREEEEGARWREFASS